MNELISKLNDLEDKYEISGARLENILQGRESPPNFPSQEIVAANQQREELSLEIHKRLGAMRESEIVALYSQGGLLLKRIVAGYMCHHFHEDYVDTIIQAIQADDDPVYLFAITLAKNLGKSATQSLLVALKTKNQRTLINVIPIIQALDIVEAVPILEELHPIGYSESVRRSNKQLINDCLMWLKRDRSGI